MASVIIGVDLGQQHDPTAIAVCELDWRPGKDRPDDHWITRHLERLPLGTPYPAVVARVGAVQAGVRTAGGGATIRTYVDATGVGQPVMDLLAAAGIRATPVYFTHGDRRLVDPDTHQVTLGKAWLVSRLQVLLQTTRIHLPDTDEARALAKELQDYEIRIDAAANDTYGAFRVGTHDDLVTALGLAVQDAPAAPGAVRAQANPPLRRLPGTLAGLPAPWHLVRRRNSAE